MAIREKSTANLDYQRQRLCGIPEVVLASDKNPEDVAHFLQQLAHECGFSFATRVDEACFLTIKELSRSLKYVLKYYPRARIAYLKKKEVVFRPHCGPVGILSAGTSDLPVAEEARVTLEILGCKVMYAYDVGVAGVHRLQKPLEKMQEKKVSCYVVIAGREAALPTLVKALVDVPVIGVPTSCGYGYGRGGESALMSILQSCSPGVVCVNIDNGFGAACAAYLIAKRVR